MINRMCKASVGVKLSSNEDHWGSPELEMCFSLHFCLFSAQALAGSKILTPLVLSV